MGPLALLFQIKHEMCGYFPEGLMGLGYNAWICNAPEVLLGFWNEENRIWPYHAGQKDKKTLPRT